MLSLTGPALCRLMRQQRHTIRTLAQRLDVPMTRVRHLRQHGTACPFTARDWVQAVTGTDPGPVHWPVAVPPRR